MGEVASRKGVGWVPKGPPRGKTAVKKASTWGRERTLPASSSMDWMTGTSLPVPFWGIVSEDFPEEEC